MRKLPAIPVLLILVAVACNSPEPSRIPVLTNVGTIDTTTFTVKNPVKKVRGQVLYVPIYSNIPYKPGDNSYNLSGFVAIHNTDFTHPIRITHVYFMNNDGKLVKDFLQEDIRVLAPLAATNFYIPEKDQSGLGANFVIEWSADVPVNEPLIESIMVNLSSGHGVSFLSEGKVVREDW
jgi:hypothetical protein